MRSFREEYQKEMDHLGIFRLEADQVSDEVHHHKVKGVYRRRAMMSAASAAAVFLLVGGVATAMSYGGGYIRVRNNGFSITSESGEFLEEEGEEEQARNLSRQRSEDRSERPEGVYAECEVESREYDSLEAFRKDADGVIVPLPDPELVGGEEAEQYVNVMGDCVYICLGDTQDKAFTLMQMDHRGDMAYASASTYGGEVVNERNYTTEQGYTYRVIDIMEEGRLCNIECAISLYGRDLLAGFRGYTQEEAYAVLESMDLGIYVVND